MTSSNSSAGSVSRCGYCNTPAGDFYLCEPCTQRLRRALRTIAEHWADLQDAASKRINKQRSEVSSGSTEAPLPFNPRASDLRQRIEAAVGRLTARLTKRVGQPPPAGTPARALWCEKRATWARMIPSVAADRGDLDYLARDLVTTIDHPNRRIPIPVPCPECGGALESDLRRPHVICCRSCSAEHDAVDFLAAG